MPLFRTLGDRIAVEIIRGQSVDGMAVIDGIFVSDVKKSTANQAFVLAEVVAAGPAVKIALPSYLVLVSDYFGEEVEADGRKLRIGRERDIAAVKGVNCWIPPADRVLLERIDQKYVGPILLPEDMRAPYFEARVLHAGADAQVNASDRVLVPKDRSVKIAIGGQRMLLIEEPSILAIL